MFDFAQLAITAPPLTVAAAIVLTALISEDVATLAAATLSASRTIEPQIGFTSAVAGIWLGDLGLYALAYRFGASLLDKPWLRKIVRRESLEKGRLWFGRRSGLALFLSRCMPGTRLPVSLAAGTFRMQPARFASIGVAGAVTWVGLNFALVEYSHLHLQHLLRVSPSVGFALTALLVLLAGTAPAIARKIGSFFKRWAQWEFWPSWIFYLPVGAMWIWLGARFRGFTLPAIANPGQKNGGLIGESKGHILSELIVAAPEFTADTHLIEEGQLEFRIAKVLSLVLDGKVT